MKKLLGILVLGLLWCNVGFAESVNKRLNKIEERLDRIEEALKPLMALQDLSNSMTSNVDNEERDKLKKCVKIDDSKSSIIDDNRNNEYFPSVEFSWMISYSNTCDKDISGTPSFSFLDKDGLLLHEAMIFNQVVIPANGSSQAKGTEIIMSKEKISRLHTTSAGLKGLMFR